MPERRAGHPPRPVDPNDPVLVRREQIRTAVRLAKRIGYALLLLAIVVFIVARVTEPRPIFTTVFAISMAISSLLLAPAIVFGYGIGAAEREERQQAAADAARPAPPTKP